MQGILSYIGEAHQFEMLQHQILDIYFGCWSEGERRIIRLMARLGLGTALMEYTQAHCTCRCRTQSHGGGYSRQIRCVEDIINMLIPIRSIAENISSPTQKKKCIWDVVPRLLLLLCIILMLCVWGLGLKDED